MTATAVLAVLCALVLLANLRWRFDVNVPAHYTPRPLNKATYPKAYVHGVTGFAIALGALVLGVPTLGVWVVLGSAIILWEFTQRGTIDFYDIVFGIVGVLDAVLVDWLARGLG